MLREPARSPIVQHHREESRRASTPKYVSEPVSDTDMHCGTFVPCAHAPLQSHDAVAVVGMEIDHAAYCTL